MADKISRQVESVGVSSGSSVDRGEGKRVSEVCYLCEEALTAPHYPVRLRRVLQDGEQETRMVWVHNRCARHNST